MKKVLITGASGWIGTTIYQQFCHDNDCFLTWFHNPLEEVGLTSDFLDISDRSAVWRLCERIRPDIIIHTAALTSAEQCEQRPERARLINEEGTRHIAEASAALHAHLVYTSTDYMFEGNNAPWSENDKPQPSSLYGLTKLRGEEIITSVCESYLILRLSLCYGKGNHYHRGFTEQMIENLASGHSVKVFTDQYRTPLYAPDIPIFIRALLESGSTGLFHMAGPERLNRHEFALRLCEIFNFNEQLLVPVRMSEVGLTAPRPYDASLDAGKIQRTTGLRFSSVTEGLRSLQRDLYGN